MKRWTSNLILLCTLLSRLPALGQSPDSAHGGSSTDTQGAEKARKLIYKVDPVYPPDLKRFYIGGTVLAGFWEPLLDCGRITGKPEGTELRLVGRPLSPESGNPLSVNGQRAERHSAGHSPEE